MKYLIPVLVCIFVSFFSPAFSQDKKGEEVFVVVENPPKFPGGEEQLYSFLSKNLVYPESAREANIEGVVYASFIVEKDGSISNVKILRGLTEECNKEVIRVVGSMPKWTPGKQRGEPVRVQYNIPVRFSLVNSSKKK